MDKFGRSNNGIHRFNNTGVLHHDDIQGLSDHLDDRFEDVSGGSGSAYGLIKSTTVDVNYTDENKLMNYIDKDNKIYNYYGDAYKPELRTPRDYNGTTHTINSELAFDIAVANVNDGDIIKINSNLTLTSRKEINKEVKIYSDGYYSQNPELLSNSQNGYEIVASSSMFADYYKVFNKK